MSQGQIDGMSGWLKALLCAVVVMHISLSAAYNFIIPLGYGPDEPHHYGYVQHLVLYRSLPKLGPADHPYLCHRDPRPPNAIGIHPPLYYVLLAPVYSLLADRSIDYTPGSEKVPFNLLPHERSKLVQRVLRFFSLLMSLLTLCFVWRIISAVFNDAISRVASFAFIAILPHFLMLSAVINNDSMTILTAHAFLYALIRAAAGTNNPLLNSALIGVTSGAMLLSKASMLSLLPLILLGVVLCLRKLSSPMQRSLCWLLAIFLPLALSGWWYARFYIMNGRLMPIVKWVYEPTMLLHSPLEFFTDGRPWHLLWRFIKGAHRSFWAQVDWFIFNPRHSERWSQFYGTPYAAFYPYSEAVYALLVALSILVIIGWLAKILKWVEKRDFGSSDLTVIISVMPSVLLYLALMHYTLFTHPGGYEGGRYLMPASASFSIALWCGMSELVPQKFRWLPAVCVIGLLVLLNALCIGNLVCFLNPIYAPLF